MADLEFFFDPVCPFAWITSRWVTEVQAQRHYDIGWRFISLSIVNENRTSDWYTPEYKAGHMAGLYGLRVADAARLELGNEAVATVYTALGTAIHHNRDRKLLNDDPIGYIGSLLHQAGLPASLAKASLDEGHDEYIRTDTDLALERTGPDVGTPILTFHPGLDDEGSFFGPVISSIPRGAEALRLWDAVEALATTSDMAELKRSNRAPLNFD